MTTRQDRPGRLARRLSPLLTAALVSLTVGAAAVAALPPRISPFGRLDVHEAATWFTGLKLSRLKWDRAACAATLAAPLTEARAIPDRPIADGCGWAGAVALAEVGTASVGLSQVRCDVAAAFSMWMIQDVQPAAFHLLGQPVREVKHYGGFACRNIVGSRGAGAFRSQHARAAAIDIAAFVLGDGRKVTVKDAWRREGPDGQFVRQVFAAACRHFRTALGPDYNAAHHDHIHVDRGFVSICR